MKRRLAQILALSALRGIALAVLLATLLMLGSIAWGGVSSISWEFLTAAPVEGMTRGGIFPAIFGTVCITLLMIVLALPLGVCAAIYMVEYAGNSVLSRVIRASVNNLAGVPSIVFGLFGVGFFVLFVGRSLDRVRGGGLLFGQPAMLWAAATLAVLVLPVIIVNTAEALTAVPRSHREASFALGATRWQTVRRVVLPQARSGILTGSILSISRGAGETAPILFTGCAYFLPRLPLVHLEIPFTGLSDPDGEPAGPVHGALVPHLHHGDPEHRRGRHAADPVRNDPGPGRPDISPEHLGHFPARPVPQGPGGTVSRPVLLATPRSNRPPDPGANPAKVSFQAMSFSYRERKALSGVTLEVPEKRVTAIIGPSGCGKSTLIKSINRIAEVGTEVTGGGARRAGGTGHLRPGHRPGGPAAKGRHALPEAQSLPEDDLRERGLRSPDPRHRRAPPTSRPIVEKSLRQAALWEEVRDRLHSPALELSGGQQQRLCLARVLAVDPEVILMDEPCSALDPISTARIEELIEELRQSYTVVIVTHNMQQAARVSDRTAFLLNGELVEVGETEKIFTNPSDRRTEDYITGRFG